MPAASRPSPLLRPDFILAVLLLVALFLPWVDLGLGVELEGGAGGVSVGSSVSGFNLIRESLSNLDIIQRTLGGDMWLLYVLYAIPVGALLVILFSVMGVPPNLFSIIAGAAPWVIAVYAFLQLSREEGAGEIFRVLGIGAYATLGVGLLLLLAGLGVFRRR